MITLDESTLIAYVDGELDAATARMVENKLFSDTNATKYVEHLREIAALSRIVFNDTLHETVPQALKDTILKGATVENTGSEANVVAFAPRPQTEWKKSLPMAAAVACLFLGLGVGGGYQYSQTSTGNALKLAAFTLQEDQSQMDMALNQALEVNMSGDTKTWANPDSHRSATFTPVRTYKDKSGTFCREYKKDVRVGDQESETTFGMACRDENGTWKTRYLLLDQGLTEAF
ncbi:MAG: hypothetical protein COB59_06330 [Rhodospirillaceae bacterium]|nr:MAG: hypothetical protein COB59_06330 [Rhodospirillaceae bacterium]